MDPQKGSVLFEGREIRGMDPDKVMRLGMSHWPEVAKSSRLRCARTCGWAPTRAASRWRPPRTSRPCGYFRYCASAPNSAPARVGGEQQMLAISRALMAWAH